MCALAWWLRLRFPHFHGFVLASKSRVSRAAARPHPWCPLGSPISDAFDSRRLLGDSEVRAASIAGEHGCSLRVVELDGRNLVVTTNVESNRIDVGVTKGVITKVSGVG